MQVGLAYLHSFGVAHRDVCAKNVMLDKDWRAKVSESVVSVLNDHKGTHCMHHCVSMSVCDHIYLCGCNRTAGPHGMRESER